MLVSNLTFLALALIGHAWAEDYHGEDAEEEMAGVAFMWPPDRAWSKKNDNTAPCGSSQGVVNRTDFPLVNGAVALVAQDESWRIQVSVSYDSNPISPADFSTFIPSRSIAEMDSGHMCYPLPDPDAQAVSTNSGNATLQIAYTSDLFGDRNETYYACADIRYVSLTQFQGTIPCFNATSDNFTAPPPEEGDGGEGTGEGNSSSFASGGEQEGGAGIVASPFAGAALVATTIAAVGFATGLI